MQETKKTFTVEEANKLIPALSSILKTAFHLHQRIKDLSKDMEDLHFIWGKDIMETGHVDNAHYMSRVAERERALVEINAKAAEISNMGCVLKDLEKGLVDFYYDNKGEIVFLCWKYGEKKVEHWHDTEGGFPRREHIDKLG